MMLHEDTRIELSSNLKKFGTYSFFHFLMFPLLQSSYMLSLLLRSFNVKYYYYYYQYLLCLETSSARIYLLKMLVVAAGLLFFGSYILSLYTKEFDFNYCTFQVGFSIIRIKLGVYVILQNTKVCRDMKYIKLHV